MGNEKLVQKDFKYIKFGKVRFIGIDAWRTGEEWDDLWGRSREFMPALDALAIEYGAGMTDSCSMMHHNGNEVDSENHFLAGVFSKRIPLCRKDMTAMTCRLRTPRMPSSRPANMTVPSARPIPPPATKYWRTALASPTRTRIGTRRYIQAAARTKGTAVSVICFL